MSKNQPTFGVWCGHLQLTQRDTDTSGVLRVRRVKPTDRPEHVQLEVTCFRHGEKRTTQNSFCFTLPPEAADVLVRGLTKCQPPYDEAARHESFAIQDGKTKDFYGIT